MTSDEALMLEFQRGSREAFDELFARYREPLFGFFRRRLENRERAEDLAQETFLAVIRATARYEPRALVRTYLYGIALKLLSADRRRGSKDDLPMESGAEPAVEEAPDSTLWVRQALEKLEAPEREILMLREYEQLSYSEIAELLKGDEVSQQYVDLQARLTNARNTEQRLTDLLRERTGRLSDVLEVEEQIDMVRQRIEQMDAEKKNLANQVSFATLTLKMMEDYKAHVQMVPPSTSTRIRNALVEGYETVVAGLIAIVLFLASWGPSLLLWAVILFFPVRGLWRRVRRARAAA